MGKDKTRLLNQYSLKLLGEDEDGYLIFDCGVVSYTDDNKHDDLPGEKLSEGRAGVASECRYKHCPDEKAKAAAIQAHVYRATDGRVNLRKQVRKGSPPPGRGKALSVSPDTPEEVEEARTRAQGPDPSARRHRVPLNEVRDSDVVEEVGVLHRFLR